MFKDTLSSTAKNVLWCQRKAWKKAKHLEHNLHCNWPCSYILYRNLAYEGGDTGRRRFWMWSRLQDFAIVTGTNAFLKDGVTFCLFLWVLGGPTVRGPILETEMESLYLPKSSGVFILDFLALWTMMHEFLLLEVTSPQVFAVSAWAECQKGKCFETIWLCCVAWACMNLWEHTLASKSHFSWMWEYHKIIQE